MSDACVFVTDIFILGLPSEIKTYKTGIDVKELKKIQTRLNRVAKAEVEQNTKANLVNIVLEDDIKETYRNGRERDLPELSKRVLSHWVKKGLIVL